MFSKLIAFGAMALALVNAAPASPSPNTLITVSCNVNLNGAPVSNQVHSAHSAGKIESGLYHIFNGKLSDHISYNALRSDGEDKPVYVLTHESPAPGTAWRVEVLNDDGLVKIIDDNLGLPLTFAQVSSSSNFLLRSTPANGEHLQGQLAPVRDSYPEAFYLQPSGDKFIIRTRDGRAWTPLPQYHESDSNIIVPMPVHGLVPEQTWIFEKY
ncbi:hypothetical protein B0H19DRAFT_1068113 [Mycena capillaripes]|nr:hypothetical protein B0H19DRAFT_1068113 [Mycena capillaripes]